MVKPISEQYKTELEELRKFVVKHKIINVIETGVQEGYSSKMFLENIPGRLCSIEYSPKDELVIPVELRNRWIYIINKSENMLEMFLETFSFDLFFHDSLHTYVHQMFEYERAYRYCKYVGSHDINRNDAWNDFLNKQMVREVFRYKRIGVAKCLG